MNSKSHFYKFGKNKAHREAVKTNLLNDLILYEHVKTTKQKAKAIAGSFDKLINSAKKNDNALTTERKLKSLLNNENAVAKLQEVLVKRFAKDQGGYLKIYSLGRRKGDNAEVVNVLVKGYVYKDIGKKTNSAAAKKAEKTKSEKAEAEQQIAQKQYGPKDDTQSRSQVSGAMQQGKVKSRSGI